MTRPVVVLGSANADLVTRVARRPGAGETVIGGDLTVLPGGKGANQAVAAARLGGRVSFVGCVGPDPYGRLLRDTLDAAGVGVQQLRSVSTPTGVALILVSPDGDNSIVVCPGANAEVGDADLTAAGGLLDGAPVLVLQREIDPVVSAAAARRVADAGGRVLLTLAPSGPVPAELLRLADPLLVNEHEAADLLRSGAGPSAPRADADTDGAGPHTVSAGPGTGEEVLAGGAALAAAILPLGPRSVVVTLGGSGAVLATADGVRTVGAPRVEVVDTTGAGDALAGALAWRLADGDDLEAALAVAVQVGSLAVTRAGAQASYPSATELERFGEQERLGQTE